MNRFYHLHVHSDFSFLKSSLTIKKMVDRHFSLGKNVISLTDIDNMHGVVDLISTMKKKAGEYDISNPKAIIGTQNYVEIESKFYSLVLIAKNYEGYRNLIKLSSMSFQKGKGWHEEEQRPSLSLELLRQYSQGIICLTSGYDGVMLGQLRSRNKEQVIEYIRELKGVFDDGELYIELVRHKLMEEERYISDAISIANELSLKLVAANEIFYLDEDHRSSNDILWGIGEGEVVSSSSFKSKLLKGGGHYIKSDEEMIELFSDLPDSIDSTVEIVEKCQIDFPKVIPHMPKIDGGGGIENLREKCYFSMNQKKLEQQQYIDRVEYEIDVIKRMGFPDYFLIVADFINAAKRQGILVGPGRGSAAGSLVAYLMGITNIDPIKEGLLFERFLNPERIDMPDIDIDFQDNRRDEVINYCKKKYGIDKIAQIVTFSKLKAKAIFKDVSRVFEIPFQEANSIAQYITGSLKETYDDNIEFRNIIQSRPELRDVYFHSLKLEGINRQTGVHASGVIISDAPIDEYSPTCVDKDGHLCTQYEGTKLENFCGLIKMDFLGLSTLSIIDETLKLINRYRDKNIDIDQIDFEDEKVYKLYAAAKTTGVFQFESNGMRHYIKELKPTEFNDLIAMNAMFRPGPMKWIPVYIAKKNKESLHFDNDEDQINFEKLNELCLKNKELATVLKVTNYIPIYQEQIMEIGRVYAGFTLGQADIMRKAMGKKDLETLRRVKEDFVQGAKKLGNDDEDSDFLFEKIISPFSGYGFNKSHAASYAYISYQIAYLKTHYTPFLMCALMNNDVEKVVKLKQLAEDALAMGVTIRPPSINETEINFTLDKEENIIYTITAIKGIASSAGSEIIKERGKSDYKGFIDFLKRLHSNTKINKQTIEQLIKSGAFDSIESLNKKQMLEIYPKILGRLDLQEKRTVGGQIDLMGMMTSEKEEDQLDDGFDDLIKKLSHLKVMKEDSILMEEESIGFSFHSLSQWKTLKEYEGLNKVDLSYLDKVSEKTSIEVVGFLDNFKEITTKNGDPMALFRVMNIQGDISSVCFPSQFEKLREKIYALEDGIVLARGRVQKNERGISLIINDIIDIKNIKNIDNKIEENEKIREKYKKNIASEKDYRHFRSIVIDLDDHALDTHSISNLKSYIKRFQGTQCGVELYFSRSDIKIKTGNEFVIDLDENFLKGLKQFSFVQKHHFMK